MTAAKMVGETTITGKNQISLPAEGVRALGWQRGDHLLVQVVLSTSETPGRQQARRASHWSRSGERGSDQVVQCSLGLAGCDDEAQVCRLYELERGVTVHAADLCGRVTAMWVRIRRW